MRGGSCASSAMVASVPGTDPSASKPTSLHSTLPLRACTWLPAALVAAAYKRSVPTAESGWTPKSKISSGVMIEPPPMPVKPTSPPTRKPQRGYARLNSVTVAPSVSGAGPLLSGSCICRAFEFHTVVDPANERLVAAVERAFPLPRGERFPRFIAPSAYAVPWGQCPGGTARPFPTVNLAHPHRRLPHRRLKAGAGYRGRGA